jgi:hypothetical protein
MVLDFEETRWLSKYTARSQSCIPRHCRQEMATSVAGHQGLVCHYIHPWDGFHGWGNQIVSSTRSLRSSWWNVTPHYITRRHDVGSHFHVDGCNV